MGSIGSNLQEVKRRIATACVRAGRAENIVTFAGDTAAAQAVVLIAVSKTFPIAAIREAHAAGQLPHHGDDAVPQDDGLVDVVGDEDHRALFGLPDALGLLLHALAQALPHGLS